MPIDKKSKNNKKNDTSNKIYQQREIYGKYSFAVILPEDLTITNTKIVNCTLSM